MIYLWLLSMNANADPVLVYHAEMNIQLQGPTFAGRLNGELYLSEDAFRVSVLGPSGSELIVFIGQNNKVRGALLPEGIVFAETDSNTLMSTLSQNQVKELSLPTLFLAQWPCEIETVICREKTNMPKRVQIGDTPVMDIHYPHYKNIDGVVLPAKIRARLPPIDWNLKFVIKSWQEVPYDETLFNEEFPEPEMEKNFVVLVEEMLKNSKTRKSGHHGQ